MATQSPFSWFSETLQQLGGRLQPPAWLADEIQHRAVLFINHVLMQEPEARARLTRQSGRRVLFQWQGFSLSLVATPAGLVDRDGGGAPDLTLTVSEASPLALAQMALRGEKPPVRVDGDVQLAAEVNWLADHVRWDAEEDLARLLGDAPAHSLAQAASAAAQALPAMLAVQPVRDRSAKGLP
jgi:ubiquinone biosynthesis protein UbiJ